MKHKNLRYVAVILAQTFVDNMDGYEYQQKIEIGNKIINFLYKWLYEKDDDYFNTLDYALMDFEQHNTDCRYECYCCGSIEECNEDIDKSAPTILDENIQEIVKILSKPLSEDDREEECNIFSEDKSEEW